MSIQRIVDYVMYSPANTNKAVLISLLETFQSEIEGKGKSKDIGSLEKLTEILNSEETNIQIKLTSNLTLSEPLTISPGKTINIDMNGKTINMGNQYVYVNNSSLSLEGNGTVQSSGRAVYVRNQGILTVNGANITSTANSAIDCSTNGHVIINDGTITAQEVGVLATNGATVEMNGGLVRTIDNFCIGGNGTSGKGGTIISINGGKLEGHITSAGYVACGIYHPQDGILNITGGEITGIGGCGVLMRAGKLNMTGGTVIATGEPDLIGKVGDSKIVVGPNGIIYDQSAHYPDNQNLSVDINGGIVVGINESIAILADEGHTAAVNVAAGTQIPAYGGEVIYYDGGDISGN